MLHASPTLPVTTPGLFPFFIPSCMTTPGQSNFDLILLGFGPCGTFPFYQSFCHLPSLCDLVLPSYLSCGLLVLNLPGRKLMLCVVLIIYNDIMLTDTVHTAACFLRPSKTSFAL